METKMSFERDLAAKASTFYERYEGKYIAEDHLTDEKLLRQRLEKWCLLSSGGQAKQFERRLSWDNMDPETIRPYLGKVHLPSNVPSPEWASFFNEFIEYAATFSFDLNDPPEYLLKEYPLPFEGFFIPLISFAETRLQALSGSSLKLMSPKALNQLKGALLIQLVRHSWKALSVEYAVYRSRGGSSLSHLLRKAKGEDNNKVLKEFIHDLTRPSSLKSFYLEYAVLARITSTLVVNWLNSNSIFLDRLEQDREWLVREFDLAIPDKEVKELDLHLSDPHNGGKSVVIVTFGNDRQVIYKPRNIEVESGFFSFLDWINKHANQPGLKVLKVISREDYGWVEFAAHTSCKQAEEVKLYYQRAGMLLCLIYMLEGNDFHFENIIASGAHPVLVDLETLFCPVSKTEVETGMPQVRWKAFEQMQSSVLKSGFLPNWKLHSDGSAYDTSAWAVTRNGILCTAVWTLYSQIAEIMK